MFYSHKRYHTDGQLLFSCGQHSHYSTNSHISVKIGSVRLLESPVLACTFRNFHGVVTSPSFACVSEIYNNRAIVTNKNVIAVAQTTQNRKNAPRDRNARRAFAYVRVLRDHCDDRERQIIKSRNRSAMSANYNVVVN